MNRTHLYVLAGLLSLAGITLFLVKVLVVGVPLAPQQQTETWRVEVQLRFMAHGGPVKAELQLPNNTGGFVLIDQAFVSPGYGITTANEGANQQAVFSIREADGEQTLYYRAVVQVSHWPRDTVSRETTPDLVPPRFEGAELAAAQALTQAARRQSADAATLAAVVVRTLKEARPGDEASLLLGPRPTQLRFARVAADLIQFAGVPVRLAHGLPLVPEGRHAGFTHWLEYYDRGVWTPLYPTEMKREMMRYVLPWWRGPAPMVKVTGAGPTEVNVTTARSGEFSLRIAMAEKRDLERRLVESSPFGLPLSAQDVFRTVLVVPVGIFLLVVLRNVVGFKTFGTFMPVLIAIAFRQTGLMWGVAFFTLVIAVGLLIRFYLERLKLLLVPRLAAVVIVVVLVLLALTMISHRLGIERGLSIGLFPIVIMTMTIERMSLVWEELGPWEALQQAAGSLVVGVLCYLIMNVAQIQHLVFVFPELLLVLLAATILLGRYSGYRLVELRRFRVLGQ